MAGGAGCTGGTEGGHSDQPQTVAGTMTTTTPRQGPPRGHQGACPLGHNCARHSHVPQQTRRAVRRVKAPDLEDVPIMAKCDPDAMVWQEQALKTQAVRPNLTPVLTRMGYQYRTTWVRGVPISHKDEVQVHVDHHLGVEGRLAAYELVGPSWQLNVISVHVPFGDATETFLEHLMEAYRQLAMMGPTVIIGDFNAAPSADDRGGRQTPGDAAVQMVMQHLGLQDLTAALRGQPSHRPTLLGRLPHRHLLRGLGTRRGDTGAMPRPTIQDHRTSTPGDTNHGTSSTPGLQGWHGPRRAATHQAARRARHPQMDSVLPHGTTHPRPARRDRPQPRHVTSGHGMRFPRTTQNTG